MKKVGLLLLLTSLSLNAKDLPRFRTWEASVAALGGATVFDIHSSINREGKETNRLGIFGSTFTSKDALLKASVIGGIVGTQYLILRLKPKWHGARIFAVSNFIYASATGGVAIHNYKVR